MLTVFQEMENKLKNNFRKQKTIFKIIDLINSIALNLNSLNIPVKCQIFG